MQPNQPGMPNMKVIMYLMPVMLFFFFNKFASGLTLYYFCGNIMNMGLIGREKYFIDEKNWKRKWPKIQKTTETIQISAKLAKCQETKAKQRARR